MLLACCPQDQGTEHRYLSHPLAGADAASAAASGDTQKIHASMVSCTPRYHWQSGLSATGLACYAAVPNNYLYCTFATPLQVVHAASDEVLVTGGYDQAVKVWDCRSRSIDPIQTMRHFKVLIICIASTMMVA